MRGYMKIGIIADVFTASELPSVGVIYANIINQLVRLDKDIKVFALSYKQIKHDLPCEKVSLLAKCSKNFSLILNELNILLQLRYARFIDRLNLDVIHCPSEASMHPYFGFVKCKKVLTLHDYSVFTVDRELIPERFTKHERFCRLLIRVFRDRIHHFITVSEDAKRVLTKSWGIRKDKLSVIYHGVDHTRFHPYTPDEISEVLDKYEIKSPYFHVSNFKPVKNVLRIVEAFSDLINQEGASDYSLVIAGPYTHEYRKVVEMIKEKKLNDKVRCIGYVKNEDLPHLYAGAAATVFPSIWESFGMPILESMACGVPVITSKAFSMPEVAGGAALLVDPFNAREIAQAMQLIVTRPKITEELKQRGLVGGMR